MHVGDAIGVVSFGSTADVAYPPAAGAVEPITGQPIKDAAMGAIDAIAFGECTFMGGGIAERRGAPLGVAIAAGAGPAVGRLRQQGMRCRPKRPSRRRFRPRNALPADVRLFSCAMGPSSDQALLESLAAATGGRYYFVPTIDDLFEIYNYIRGQVSGDAIAVNQSGTASFSVVPAFVDASAELRPRSPYAWADRTLRAVFGDARKAHEVSVRLRDPGGRLLPANAAFVRRLRRRRLCVFRIDEPMPGQWRIEVTTLERTHVRYTAAVFLRSPLRLVVTHSPLAITLGQPFEVTAVIEHGSRILRDVPTIATISRPAMSVKQLLEKHRAHLRELKPTHPGGDSLPEDVAKLLTLQRDVAGCERIFDQRTMRVKMRPSASRSGRAREICHGRCGQLSREHRGKGHAAEIRRTVSAKGRVRRVRALAIRLRAERAFCRSKARCTSR